MNSNMVKPENFDHLHLVYHFTVPLSMYELSVDTSYQRIKYENIEIVFRSHKLQKLLTIFFRADLF